MVRVILLRHGETTWNAEGRYQGQKDTPLSARGIEQGKLAAEALKNVRIDACVSSPLSRAFDTCSFTAAKLGLPVATDARLLEINHGDWEGVLADDIERAYPALFRLWHTNPDQVKMPGEGGETLDDVLSRSRAALDDIAGANEGKTVLVAAHDAVNRSLICSAMGLPLSRFWQFKQDNACINVLERNNGAWRVVLLNSTLHLGYLYSGIEQKGL